MCHSLSKIISRPTANISSVQYSTYLRTRNYSRIMQEDYSAESLSRIGQPSLSILPTEILFVLFEFFKPKDMIKCRQVCTKWRDIIDVILEDDAVWERFCKRDYTAVANKAMWTTPDITNWFEMYQSLSTWGQLPLARESAAVLCQSDRIEEEIRDVVVQEHGIVMVHKRGGVSYHDLKTLGVADRKGFAGQYSSIQELEDIVIMLGLNAQLHLVKKPNPNWSSDLTVNTGNDDEISFHDVQCFIVGDRTLYYYTYNRGLFSFNLDNDNVAHRIVLEETFDAGSLPSLGSWGYKDGCLNILTMSEKLYAYTNKQVQLKCTLGSVTNLMDCLYRHGMLENLDWRQYYILRSDLRPPPHTGFLRCISIIKVYRDDIFFVATQCIVSIKMYYKPFSDGQLDFSKFKPIKEFNLSDQISSLHIDYLIINSIEVVEIKDGHKILVCVQGKIFVITFKNDFEGGPSKRGATKAIAQ